jgi:hypothetical protein
MREDFKFPFPHLSSWNGAHHPGTASDRSEESIHIRDNLQILLHVRFSYGEWLLDLFLTSFFFRIVMGKGKGKVIPLLN